MEAQDAETLFRDDDYHLQDLLTCPLIQWQHGYYTT